MPHDLTPADWFRHLFRSKAALDGAVVRRKIRDMERMVGRQRFYDEIARRGFSAIENADQVIVFCNSETLLHVVDRGQTFEESLASNPLQGFGRRVSSKL